MDPQVANFFTRWTEKMDALASALTDIETLNQEAIDRSIPIDLGTIVFEGELDHLTESAVLEAFAAYVVVNSALAANGREGWEALYRVIR